MTDTSASVPPVPESGSLIDLAEAGEITGPAAEDILSSRDRLPHANARTWVTAERDEAQRDHDRRLSEVHPEGVTLYGEGLDFSGTGPFGCFASTGRNFVAMYVKWVGAAGFNAARAAGLRPVAIYETTGVDYRGGRGAGQYAGGAFQTWCNANGFPQAEAYNTFDEDVGNFGVAGDYELGWHDRIGPARTNGYAKSQLITYLLDGGFIRRGWVTYAWSGGALDPRATLYQNPNDIYVCGVNCDRDRAFQPTIGAIGETPAPPPAPPAPPDDDAVASLTTQLLGGQL